MNCSACDFLKSLDFGDISNFSHLSVLECESNQCPHWEQITLNSRPFIRVTSFARLEPNVT